MGNDPGSGEAPAAAPALGVYVHWPYCARICPYCDFNVYRRRDVDGERWARALQGDLGYWAGRIERRALTSVYFGGGTPSLAPAGVVESVIGACERLFGFDPGAEITLEANPADVSSERIAAWRTAGVNRLSLGVQSFDDRALRVLGRDHDAGAARRAIDLAQAGFSQASFDLIYALPGQSLEGWKAELAEALAFAPTHLSLYQLTIEPGTAFDRAVARGAITPTPEDSCADFYDLAQTMTMAAGLSAYEVSNHAVPGAQSRHNRLYWTYQDYIGIGPGAHGRLTVGGRKLAVETHRRPDAYLDAAERAGTGVALEATLDREAILVERVSMGLRLSEGLRLSAEDMRQLGQRARRLSALAADGLLIAEEARLAATPAGRRVLNELLRTILA